MKTPIKIEVKEENGYQYIELSNSLMKKMGWKIGDTIDWQDNKDGTWSLLKVASPCKSKKNKI
jgi:uncharacterized membrane protein (UPF0127 family)